MRIIISSVLSRTRPLPLPHNLSLTTASRKHKHNNSASAKLFEDAKREEREEKQAAERRRQVTDALLSHQAERNWDGEEPLADAVLRMLVDKYKPLRSGTVLSADEKLSKAVPPVRGGEVSVSPNRPVIYPKVDPSKPLKDQPLLPAVEGHRPWQTNFTPPSHATAAIRHGNFKPLGLGPPPVLDEKTRKLEKENQKRLQTAFRLEGAKESVLDHRLGVGQRNRMRANPLTMKGWRNLVEERIERARAQGHLDKIEGRGKPMAISDGERNPFIAREEFLMNRIVQRNGAAPPWVELQAEMESAIASFRQVLKQAWSRRVLIILTTETPPPSPDRLTVDYIANLRDLEWEERERSYHDTALDEVNSLVRKHNAMAPYVARRAPYMRNVELERTYRESAGDIHQKLVAKLNGGRDETTLGSGRNGDDDDFANTSLPSLGIWAMVRNFFTRVNSFTISRGWHF